MSLGGRGYWSKYLRHTCPPAVSYLSWVKSGDLNHAVTTEKEHGDTPSGAAHTRPPQVGVKPNVLIQQM